MSADRAVTGPTNTLPPVGEPVTLPPEGAALDIPDHVSVPGYEITGELGRGGMGVVYKARQLGLNREVALKMILSGGHASAGDFARFRAEAEAVARLQHPNVVQIYEVGESGGLPYFSLEFCPGGSLEKLLAGTPQPPREAAVLIETLARAVHAAHQAGIVHRDLKPANVLLSFVPGPLSFARHEGMPDLQGTKDQGQGTILKITDFGLAKQIDSGTGRTASGAILGTPSYMAPEQANGSKEIGPAADTYALGAILYELLTGRPPFRAATPLDTIMQVVGAEPVPPKRLNAQVPRDLETIALKCLQKEPAKRYASAAALADDLHRWQAGEPIAARPAGVVEKAVKWAKRRPAIVTLAAAVVLAVAGGFGGILYELRVANEARTRAETQEGIANQRADELSNEQLRVRLELHRSDLLRADLLLQGNEPARAEQVLWRSHFTRPDDDDRRAFWRLWELYRQRPRRSGAWIGAADNGALSLDGRRVAVVREARVTIYDAVTGAVHTEFTPAQTKVRLAGFSQDGSRLGLTSLLDGSVTVWELDPAPALLTTLRPSSAPQPNLTLTLGLNMLGKSEGETRRIQHESFFGATTLCFLDDDRVLVADAINATLWKLKGPAVVTRFEIDRSWGKASLPAAPTGDIIPVLGGGRVELWNLPRTTGGTIARTRLDFTAPNIFRRVPLSVGKTTAAGGSELIDAVALSRDGKWLITGTNQLVFAGQNRRLRVWDVASGAIRGEAQDGAFTFPFSVAVSPDGAALQSIDKDVIRLWRLPGLEPIRIIPRLCTDAYGRFLGFSSNGRQACTAEDNIVAIYDHEPTAAVRPLVPPDQVQQQEKLGNDLASVGPVVTLHSPTNSITAWIDGRADRITVPQGMLQPEESVCAISPAGTTAVTIRANPLLGATLTIYDLAARRITRSFAVADTAKGMARFPSGIVFTPDGHTVAVATERGFFLADLTTAKVIRVLPAAGSAGSFGVVFTPDGRAAAYSGISRGTMEIVLCDVSTGHLLARSVVSPMENPIGFAPDGAFLATMSERRLILRDAATLAEVGEIPGTVKNFGTGVFAPDGSMIATGGNDGKLRLWDVRRREELVATDLASGPISKVVFTPDGSKVRFIAEKQVGELDLHAYDPYVEGNLTWNLLRLLPELDRTEAERVLERLRTTHPDAYRAGIAAMPSPH